MGLCPRPHWLFCLNTKNSGKKVKAPVLGDPQSACCLKKINSLRSDKFFLTPTTPCGYPACPDGYRDEAVHVLRCFSCFEYFGFIILRIQNVICVFIGLRVQKAVPKAFADGDHYGSPRFQPGVKCVSILKTAQAHSWKKLLRCMRRNGRMLFKLIIVQCAKDGALRHTYFNSLGRSGKSLNTL